MNEKRRWKTYENGLWQVLYVKEEEAAKLSVSFNVRDGSLFTLFRNEMNRANCRRRMDGPSTRGHLPL